MREPPTLKKAIEFKSASLFVMATFVRDVDPACLEDALHALLGDMPDFFNGEATVLDFSQLGSRPRVIDWTAILGLLRRYHLQPLGVRHLDEPFDEAARHVGLAILPIDESAARIALEEKVPPAPPPTATQTNTLIVERPVRSGQQIYARGSDLVVLGSISNGAEVVADGNIHCYGALRGRALAGARGELRARIFTTGMGAELVSIAGVYRTFELGMPDNLAGRPAQISLSGEGEQQHLLIAPLSVG